MRTKIIVGLCVSIACLGGYYSMSKHSSAPSTAATEKTHTDTVTTISEAPLNRESVRKGSAEKAPLTGLAGQITAAMESSDPDVRASVFSLLSEWMRLEPTAAAKFVETLGASDWRKALLSHVAQAWANLDPTSAQAWVGQLPSESERLAGMTDIHFQITQREENHESEVPPRPELKIERANALENSAQQWAKQDFDSAETWVKNLPASEQRDRLFQRLVLVQASKDPAAAAELVSKEISSGSVQIEAAITVVHQWAKRSPADASAWVDQFPPGELRARAKEEISGMVKYLNSIPNSR
jgi:hypothetical protein